MFTGSGSYRYFGNKKLYKQGKNILKIEVLHIFRWIFPFFMIKIIIIQISEEICLTWKKFRCLKWFLVSATRIQDPGPVFKILICWIRIRPKMDRIHNPVYRYLHLKKKISNKALFSQREPVGFVILNFYADPRLWYSKQKWESQVTTLSGLIIYSWMFRLTFNRRFGSPDCCWSRVVTYPNLKTKKQI